MLEVFAYAKINLHLRVIGRRRDGYHELRTLLQTVDLCDQVRARSAPPGVVELTVTPPGVVSADADNLVVRTAEVLRRYTDIGAGAKIELVKRIPVGAGLGGGSSDAAATLVLLDTLWDLDLKPSELMAVAADLGSDVPFFLIGGLAWATGRGETVQPLADLKDYGVVLCTPPFEVSTPEVYARFAAGSRLTSPGSDARVEAFVADAKGGDRSAPPWRELENDLESIVIEGWPEVGRAIDALRSADPLHAAITGSGASAFAIFRDIETARTAARGLKDIWNVQVISTVDRGRGRPTATRCENREEFA